MNSISRKPKGFITMVSLLIVASIAMFFAINMLMDGLDNANLSINSMRYELARVNVSSCLEDVLLRVKKNDTFTESLRYDFSDSSYCTVDFTWFSESSITPLLTEQLATLNILGSSDGFVRQFEYQIKIKKFTVNDSDGSIRYLKTIDFASINEV